MDYKEVNRIAYSSNIDTYQERSEKIFKLVAEREASLFLSLLPNRKILDLGAGTGAAAGHFLKNGYRVWCVDFSREMLARCPRTKDLHDITVIERDIEELEEEKRLQKNFFGGIWAYGIFDHFPKDRIPPIVKNITRHLTSNGIFAYAVKKGKREGHVERHWLPGVQRWRSYFTSADVETYIASPFEEAANVKGNSFRHDFTSHPPQYSTDMPKDAEPMLKGLLRNAFYETPRPPKESDLARAEHYKRAQEIEEHLDRLSSIFTASECAHLRNELATVGKLRSLLMQKADCTDEVCPII